MGIDISDLPVPTAADSADISDLPIPYQNLSPANPATGPGALQIGPFDTGVQIPGWLNRTLEGAGKAGYDLARGAGQWVGLENRQDVAQSQQLDAPLMATTAGKVGDVIGNIGFNSPAMLIPGVNSLVGGAALGAGMGALTPSTSTGHTLENIGLGGALGAAGGYVGNKISDWAAAQNAARETAAQEEAGINADRDAVLAQGKKAGYVIPPTAAKPNVVNTALESISGNAATRQSAMAANQKVTNALVRSDLGIASNQPISPETLAAVRQKAGAAYDAVKKLGTIQSDPQYFKDLRAALVGGPNLETFYPGISSQADEQVKSLVDALNVPVHNSEGMVEGIKQLRNLAKRNFQSAFAAEGNPDRLAIAQGQRDAADALEDLIGRHLETAGHPELAQEWNAARQTIAKSHQIEGALQGSNVNARGLAAQLRKGKPVTGAMGLVAKFANHFPEVSAVPKSGAGVSKLAATLATAGELGGAYLHDAPLMGAGVVAAATPYATRAAMLSRAGQSLLATPSYDPSLVGTLGLRAIEAAGRRGALAAGIPLNQLIGGK